MAASIQIDVLSGTAAFEMLDEALLREIAAKSTLLLPEDHNDEFLFRAGDMSEGLFLILPADRGDQQGPAVQVSFGDRNAATSRVGYRLMEGEFAGDLEFLSSGLTARLPRRIASARALRPLRLLHVPTAVIVMILRESGGFRRMFVAEASTRIADLLSEKATETAVHPEVRLAEGLLGLLSDYGHVVANRGVFTMRLRQQEIADRLGMSRRLFSLRTSDWSARGLVETAPFGLPDHQRVNRIASFGREAVRDVLPAAIEEVEALIARGMPSRANLLATDALVVFPGNPVLSHLLAMTAARMGARERAAGIMVSPGLAWDGSMESVKSRLREAWYASLRNRHGGSAELEEEDETSLRAFFEARLPVLAIDVGALHARLQKDRIDADAETAVREAEALRAAELYRQVHEARRNHYCAVNAASLYAVAGRTEEANALAAEALRLAQAEKPNYWAAASRGEALLVLGRGEEAASAFSQAVALPDADLAKSLSTRRQLGLMAKTTALDVAPALAPLDPGSPVFFSGPLMADGDASPETLAGAAETLGAAIAAWLAGRQVPVAFSAAACGADILFAEAALSAGTPLHVILPFAIDRFAELSVRIGQGWERRFLRCLDRAASVTELWPLEIARGAVDHHFRRANLHMAGEAIMAAHLLQTRPHMLAVRDGRTAGGVAGTAWLAEAFAALGHPVSVIRSPFERPSQAGGTPAHDPFSPVVFAFARAQSDNEAAAAVMARHGLQSRAMKDRRLAGQRVFGDWQEARAAASLIARQSALDGTPLRVLCDYGPVRKRDGGTDEEALLKLEAAFDLTAAAFGEVFATAAFVMSGLAAGGKAASCTPVNIAVEQEPGDRLTVRGARQIYRIAERQAA